MIDASYVINMLRTPKNIKLMANLISEVLQERESTLLRETICEIFAQTQYGKDIIKKIVKEMAQNDEISIKN